MHTDTLPSQPNAVPPRAQPAGALTAELLLVRCLALAGARRFPEAGLAKAER